MPSQKSTAGIWFVALAAFAIIGGLVRAEPEKPDEIKGLLEEKDLKVLIDGSVKYLQDSTKKPNAFPNSAPFVEGEAALLLVYSKIAMANGDGRGPVLRDAAMSLKELTREYRQALVAKDEMAQAKFFKAVDQQIQQLADWEKFKPAGKDDVPLSQAIALKDLMEQVKLTSAELMQHSKLAPAAFKNKRQKEQIIQSTNKMLALTAGMVAHTPAVDPNPAVGKTKKLWFDSSIKVRENLIDLLKAAQDGDGKKYKEVHVLMERSCGSCHDKFKP